MVWAKGLQAGIVGHLGGWAHLFAKAPNKCKVRFAKNAQNPHILLMNKRLETRFTEAKALSDTQQDRLADVMGEFIASVQDSEEFQANMGDPEYRAYIESALAEGEADIAAGNTFNAQQILERSADRLKKLHG